MTSLDSLVAIFVATKPLERSAVVGELTAALCRCSTASPAGGKENSRAVSAGRAKAVRAAATTVLKGVLEALSTSSLPTDVADLIALGRASLSALDAHSTDAGAAQLPALRYNLLRRLVTLKAYGPGLQEALFLRVQLSAVYGGEGGRVLPPSAGSPPAQEAVNLAVGAALILLLCCAESGQPSCQSLGAVLQAARDLPAWLRCDGCTAAAGLSRSICRSIWAHPPCILLHPTAPHYSLIKPEEAARHGDAAYRSLYKMAVVLIETRSWASARDAAAAMVAAAATDTSQARRAVQAAGKFLGHLPETEAAELLVELASGYHCLPAAAADDLLGPLCSAAQRAEQSAMLHEAFSMVSASGSPILRQAALLLPMLGMEGERALQLAADAAAEAEGSLAALERHLGAQQLPPTELHRHLAIAGAAFQTGNTLRRLLSVDCKGAAAPSSAAAQLAAAAALELLAGTVGVGTLVLASAAPPEAVSLPFAGQGHAAAVALVSAARLRATASAAPPTSSMYLRRLLGWDCLSETAPPTDMGSCPVEPSELAWMASALFNVGVDLHAAGQFAAAVPPLRDAVAAAGVCLAQCAESGEVC